MNPKDIQRLLNRAGSNPPVPVTGRLDRDTTEAIRDFQIAAGLPVVSGRVDAQFLGALRKAAAEAESTTPEAQETAAEEASEVGLDTTSHEPDLAPAEPVIAAKPKRTRKTNGQ